MSQTSRSRIIAAQRHRRGLAIAIAQDQFVSLAHGKPAPGLERIILSGTLKFDVHRAREYAKTLVKLELDQAVFEDWTRARGKGPENREPGEFRQCPRHGAECENWFTRYCGPGRGGWPGKLAREWLGDPRAPMGRSLARLGRRLLEAIEGQPDECKRCKGWCDMEVVNLGSLEMHPCTSCHGTGHNIAGVLPPIEVTPQLARNVVDATRDLGTGLGLTSWQRRVFEDPNQASRDFKGVTRVVPRGEHRTDFCLDFAPWPGSNAGDLDTYAWRCAPKWLRGRLTHAQQRRERARTHVHITAVLPGLIDGVEIEGTLTV